MASTTSSQQQNAFSGIEPPNKRRKIEESSRVFDVFINHRGPDVKLTLATQLYNSLDALGIKAFLDSEEKERGVSFISTIETAIRSASVHIAIFSKGYAESDWCLRELVLMLQSNARIIPVFYQVQPWELRHIENGVYAAAFRKYEEKGRYLDKIKEWKEALQQVSYNAGDIFENPDSSECKNIVSAVEKEVKRTKKLHVAKYPVGLHMLVKDFERRCLNELVQDFESQCGMKKAAKDRANVVGIFGMGGVGKTTLSLELFNQKRLKYTSASFLYDVREAYSRGNMPLLQSQLLKDIFCEGNHSFASDKEGMSYLTDRLEKSSSASFLIVVDDIDDVEQLHALIPMDILNKSDNNLVIVTTRNVGALVNAGIDIAYHLKGLDRDYGRELFCWHAFGKPLPNSRYENLVQDFVDLCGGLPLSIIVLGRHLFGRDQLYWQAELEKVKEILPGEIKRRLKISIDTLDNVEKQIFMDIACFFIGKSITKVMNMWKGSGWRVRHALKTLKEKCLVEEVEESYLNRLEYKWEPSVHGTALRMHDHLRDLGREMADELSHPPRVWRPQVLKSLESKGFRNILAQTKGRSFHSFFDKSMSCNIAYFLGEPEDSSASSLLWLQLEYLNNCPLDLNSDINSSICSWIPLQNLQCLRISNGCFRKLWQTDVQAPSHLKELQIRDTFLEEFPDSLRKLNSMEKLVLDAKDIQTDNWSLLESIGMNFRSLKMMGSALAGDLAYNDTAEVITFKSLVIYDFRVLWEEAVVLNNERWSRTVMNDVENLEINNYGPATKILINGNCCQRLQSLKICEMKNLIEVDLARIKTLSCLEITYCENFKRLSATPDLCKLVELKITECLELEELRLAHLSCLEKISIKNCNHLKSVSGAGDVTKLTRLIIGQCPALEELPSLARLSCLKDIVISSCEKLQNLTLPTTLIKLDVQSCRDLQKVAGAGDVTKLTRLNIGQCPALEELPSLARVGCLKDIVIDSCEKLQNITLPTTLSKLDVQSCRDLQRVAGAGDVTKLTWLIIRQCPALEELPSLARVGCLKDIVIDSCEKLQNITLPTTLIYLDVQSCRDLQRVAGAGDVTKLIIKQCPALEELLSLTRMSCLEVIEIDSCDKLQSITLPTTPIKLDVRSCRDLHRIAVVGDATKLTRLSIGQCPALEELLSLTRMSCLEVIEIDSCDKLQSITLPTTPIKLDVRSCRDLHRIAVVGDATKLTWLSIGQCPALEELPSLARMSCLEVIEIDSCDKLQSITLPTTPIKLYVGSCRDLHRIALVGDLTKLKSLTIKQCPALEELPSLARMSCLEDIVIDSCQKLHNVAGIEESYELEWMILNNCGNAVIRNCIHGLKSLPIAFLKMIGKAVDGAEASLNKNLFCDANIGVHAVIENDSENTVSEWPIWNSGIGCYLVVIDNEDEDEDEDDSFNAREGEWIITMVGPDYLIYDACKNLLRRNGIVKKGVLIEVTDGEQWTNVEVLRRIVDRLYHL